MRYLITALLLCAATTAQAQNLNAASAKLQQQFTGQVQPFLAKSCAGCHGGNNPAGGLDLRSITSLDQVTADFARWSMYSRNFSSTSLPCRYSSDLRKSSTFLRYSLT